MLGPVSPMDRPDPTETNRPLAGVALRRAKECKRLSAGGLSSLCEPIRPRYETRLDGGVVRLGEKNEALLR